MAGWQQSHWGYGDVHALQQMVEEYSAAHIPLEVVWSDVDYMDGLEDFTLDPINFAKPQLDAFLDTLHSNGQKYVLILDPGIKIDPSYAPYSAGLSADVFVKNIEGRPYIGQVWVGPSVWPDFLHPNATSYWTSFLGSFHDTVAYDGIWIDMNEPSNFCSGPLCSISPSGPCPPGGAIISKTPECCLQCNITRSTRHDVPPFAINHMGDERALGWKTIAMSAVHFGGVLAYDAHNLYGLTEAMATSTALRSVSQKRPFVLSRSTFPGSGAHTAHWTGDNAASWEDLRFSIVQVLNFGLFGIPMVGADIW